MILIHVIYNASITAVDLPILYMSAEPNLIPLGFNVASLRKTSRKYGKCSKMLNTFLVLISNTIILVNEAGIHKMLVRLANGVDPDQTASSEAV